MKKNKIIVGVLFSIICISIGFAYLTTELNIGGVAGVQGNKWDIHFENVVISNGSVESVEAPFTDNLTTTSMSYAFNLDKPGDYYEFSVDIANRGTINAMVNVVPTINGITGVFSDAVEASVKYTGGGYINSKDLLEKQTSHNITVRVEYKMDITPEQLINTDDPLNLSLEIDYVQADSDANIVDYVLLNNLVNRIKNNELTMDDVGYTVNVDVGKYGIHPVRVANVSTPDECSNPDFSQSACGVVLEFADIITSHKMNVEYSNVGGWTNSWMREFVNGELFDQLTYILRDNIILTKTISGRGSWDSNESGPNKQWVADDKLYLLATAEIWAQGSENVITHDLARDYTRQLDFYANNNVDTVNYAAATKVNKNNNPTFWWLRSAYGFSGGSFSDVATDGRPNNNGGSYSNGVSPAFRIG